MNQPELEPGEEILLSYRKALMAGCTVLVALTMGVLGVLISLCTLLAWRANQVHWTLALFFGLGTLFVGVCALIYTVLVGPALVMGVLRHDRLRIGEKALQCVARDGQILTHVPYDNIDEITLEEASKGEAGPPFFMVGITLIDPRHAGTILGERSPVCGEEGYDVVIRDFYRKSPKQLYKKLRNKWKRHH